MSDLGAPPQLYIPARPAIIRAHQGDLDALARLERDCGIKALLPGMVPVIAGAASLGTPPSYTFIGAYVATISGTNLVKTGLVVPAAGLLLIMPSGRGVSNFELTGVEVSTVAADQVVRTPAGFRNPTGIFSIGVAAPATVDVTAYTGAAAVGTLAFALLTGLSSNFPVDIDNGQSASNATSSALSLGLPAGAIGIWSSTHREPEGVTWTNATELHDTSGGGNHEHSSAIYQATDAETRMATAAWTTGDEWSMVAAAWR